MYAYLSAHRIVVKVHQSERLWARPTVFHWRIGERGAHL